MLRFLTVESYGTWWNQCQQAEVPKSSPGTEFQVPSEVFSLDALKNVCPLLSHLEGFVDAPDWRNDHGQVGHSVPELGDVPAHL